MSCDVKSRSTCFHNPDPFAADLKAFDDEWFVRKPVEQIWSDRVKKFTLERISLPASLANVMQGHCVALARRPTSEGRQNNRRPGIGRRAKESSC